MLGKQATYTQRLREDRGRSAKLIRVEGDECSVGSLEKSLRCGDCFFDCASDNLCKGTTQRNTITPSGIRVPEWPFEFHFRPPLLLSGIAARADNFPQKQQIPLRPHRNDLINKQSSSALASSRTAALHFAALGPSCTGPRVPLLLNFFRSALSLLGTLFFICQRAQFVLAGATCGSILMELVRVVRMFLENKR